MTVIDHLASSLDRKDETPNLELAARIAKSNDQVAVAELLALLEGKNKKIRHDSIKVLYELGALNPRLIEAGTSTFQSLLSSKDNRMVWGAMTALHSLVERQADALFQMLPDILQAVDAGSVITRDQAVGIMIGLVGNTRHAKEALPLLREQLRTCPENQFPMYAERSMEVLAAADRAAFVQLLEARLPSLSKASGQKRVERVLRRVMKA